MEDDKARLPRRVCALPQFSYTNRESQEKAKQLAAVLADYQLQSKLYLVPFADVQRHIMVDTPLETRVILYRRYMMRIAEQIAIRERARVLVTGDSVGQVASQTIENIDVISRAIQMPILRPLIGEDKSKIVELRAASARTTSRYSPTRTAVRFFVPKHPETRANLFDIERSEARLDVADAMKQSLETSQVVTAGTSFDAAMQS